MSGQSTSSLRSQAQELARLIGSAEHCIFVTGAGISTNPPAGLRDYRGPEGIWTEAAAAGKVVGEPGSASDDETPWDAAFYQLMPLARPTYTHRAITRLAQPSEARGGRAFVKHVITQNEDGLHRRAALPAEQLSESVSYTHLRAHET